MLCCGNLENDFNKRVKSLDRLLGEIRLRFKPKFIDPRIHHLVFMKQIRYAAVAISNTFGYLCPAVISVLI